MKARIKLRAVSPEEASAVRGLARSRTRPARLVQRAKVIVAMLDDPQLTAAQAGIRAGFAGVNAGAKWIRRFTEGGIAGLEDTPRPGRPRTHSEQTRGALIALARQKPPSLGYPFALWTLERLQEAFVRRNDVHLSDSTIWEWLDAEGLQWKRQQSWFTNPERHDPQFAEKRGPSSRHIGNPRKVFE